MKVQIRFLILTAVSAALAAAAVHAQQVTKQSVTGITNFARVETTIACGGATKPEAIAELKKMGFAAIFNMRMASEAGADIPAEEAAAKAAGMNFIHIPYDTQKADASVADRFLAEIRKPGNQPAYIHCAGGSRAAGMWLIKRALVDRWDVERATTEATELGLNNDRVKQYALDYVKNHK